jgi:tetratricopeptide (TPR) repeat protein
LTFVLARSCGAFGRGAAAFALAGALACSALQPSVARRVDGVTSEGRFIEPDAYALYAVAALREARGEWGEALQLYESAFEMDGRGPELRTRIGAVACKLHQDKRADRAFAAAARAAADYGPLWFELAQCRQVRGDVEGALRAALEAVRLDPERYETSLLAADLAEQRGNRTLAWRLRDGLATHAPDAPAVQRSLLAAAQRNHDEARAARARAALGELEARFGVTPTPRAGARAIAALERGDVTVAKRESERLLGADPSNGDALVIALCVADLEQNHAAFNALLERAPDSTTPVSADLRLALAGLLARRVSAEAAQLVRSPP